jgi:hypothetical protein
MNTKIKKITSKWIVEVGEETFEYDNLFDAEKKFLNVLRAESEGYLIRKDYHKEELIDEILLN